MQQTSNSGVYPAKLKTQPLGLGPTGLDYRLFSTASATAYPHKLSPPSLSEMKDLPDNWSSLTCTSASVTGLLSRLENKKTVAGDLGPSMGLSSRPSLRVSAGQTGVLPKEPIKNETETLTLRSRKVREWVVESARNRMWTPLRRE